MTEMDDVLGPLLDEIHSLAPEDAALVRLFSRDGESQVGALKPSLSEALDEAVRTACPQKTTFLSVDGDERSFWVAPMPGLGGHGLALEEEAAHRLLAPVVENLVNQIAHDVRNYAFTVGLQAEMGTRRAASAPEVKGHFEAVLRQVDGLKQYLQHLLAYGRSPSLALAELDPVALIREIIHQIQFSRPADAVPLSIRIEAEPLLGKVRWDPRSVGAALLALCDNAVRSADPPPSVTVHVAQDGNHVVIEVRDDGPGISPDILERLTLPMAVRRAGGAGLGLAIARKMATAHGGVLAIESSSAGTTVSLRLPTEVATG